MLQIHYPITSPEQRMMFSNQRFSDELRDYLQTTYHVEVVHGDNVQRGSAANAIVQIHGSNENAQSAREYLTNLLSSLRTEIFGTQLGKICELDPAGKHDASLDDQWTRIPEAIGVLQNYFKEARIFCVCQRDQPDEIRVHFFDESTPHFGISENGMRSVLKDVFTFKTIPYKSQAAVSQVPDGWTELERQVRQRDDYGRKICLMRESNGIHLFGISKLVKQYEQAFEASKAKQIPQPFRITLSERQVHLVPRCLLK